MDKENISKSQPKQKAKNPFALVSIIVAVLFICGICGLAGYYAYNYITSLIDTSTATSLKEMERVEGNEVVVFGKVKELDSNLNFFIISDGGSSLTIFYSGVEGVEDLDISDIANEDWVVVHGIYSSGNLNAKKISVATEEEINSLRGQTLPELTFYVNDYPSTVQHSCRPFEVDVTVVNSGQKTISHTDIYDSLKEMRFFYRVNNGKFKLDNYFVLAEDGDDPYKLGLGNFGTLEPGEEKDVKFYGGGMVTATVDEEGRIVGYSGEHNIFSPNPGNDGVKGSNTLELIWASSVDADGNYIGENPDIITTSETMLVNLDSSECDTTDVIVEEIAQ